MLNKKFFLSIILVLITFSLLFSLKITAAEKEISLHVYSGAGLRKPMDDIAAAFEKEAGIKINYSYAGSAQNLSQLQMVKEGDIYIPGSRYYYEQAKKKNLTTFVRDVAYHIPVIAVPKGNPADIENLSDLANEGVKVTLGDERANAIGRLSKKILSRNNILDVVEKNVIAKTATVNELVIYINMNQADASIIWEDNIAGTESVEIIHIDKEKNEIKTIPISVLKYSENKEAAVKFAEFVASEKGKAIYEKHGFKKVTN